MPVAAGNMEYVRNRGSYADVPREEILAAWREAYPASSGWGHDPGAVDFEREAGTEI